MSSVLNSILDIVGKSSNQVDHSAAVKSLYIIDIIKHGITGTERKRLNFILSDIMCGETWDGFIWLGKNIYSKRSEKRVWKRMS